jgi:peptide/nickel transport system permease protein
MRVLPGDIVDVISGDVITSPEVKEALREEIGLNDPLVTQYGRWLGSMLSGGFGGYSLLSGQPIGELLIRQLPVTLLLAFYTVVLSFLISIPMGILAALKCNRWQDYIVRLVSLPGQALPDFWLALLLILGFLLLFQWSPPLVYSHPWQDFGNHIQMVILPVLLLVWAYSSHIVRVTRASILGTMQEDYFTAAYAQGFSEWRIVWKHSLRAAAAPVITVMGLQLSTLLGGVIILESVFGLPGIGRGLVDAALSRDFLVVQSYVTMMVFIVLLINLLIDLGYKAADPRVYFTRQVGFRL